jgi:dCTP deaminase
MGEAMILVDHAIQDRVSNGDLQIRNFSEDCVQPASYDLRIGELIYAPSQPDKPHNMASNGGAYRLPPYGAAILQTYEDLKLPGNVLGRIGLKSGFARKGLIASTGPQIDPGFEGKLFISLFNLTAGAHVLKYKDSFLTIEFHTLDDAPTHTYQGPYQGRYTVGPEVLESLVRLEGLTLSQMQSQFTELTKHVEKWSSFAGRFDEFLATMNAQSEVMRDLVSLVKSHDAVIARGGESVTAIPAPIRDMTVQQAADEILVLFRKKKKLYYSDIAEQLSIDLRLVIKACALLEKRGLIEGATNVTRRAKRSRP